MKKILFLLMSVITCNAFGANATYNCTVQSLSGASMKVSNEYLFPTIAHHNDANGMALVCGHRSTEGCDNGTIVLVTGPHVWKNENITDAAVYSCSTSWGNAWANIGSSLFNKCSSTENRRLITTIGDKDIYAPIDVVNVYAVSEYYIANDFCWVLHETENEGNNSASRKKSKKSCKDKRDTPEGKACCDLPTETATWDEVNKKCICSGGKLFLIGKNGRGSCAVSEGDGGAQFRCPATDVSHFARWKTNCASHAATLQLIAQIEALCATPNVTADQYNDLYADVTASVAINCQQVITETITETIEITVPSDSQSRAAIIAAGSALDGIVAGFGEANVWKNAQGEFNTARLASDSIAAVVLGTAGGLITSSVMKKHQVEDGFEDLKCVIGGQPVAGWGDEFRVGIQ